MVRNICLLFLFCLFATPFYAQTLSVFNVDPSEFPQMKANFFAFDQDDKQMKNLNKNDFIITENGEERVVTNVSCPKFNETEAISSVLTIDVSGSMSGSGLSIAKTASKLWVNTLPLGKSECAITSFTSSNNIVQDFTTKQERLISAIDRLSAGGGTDFDAGFIEPMSGALLVADSGKHKKVIVFLSDGYARGDQNAIIQKANNIDATIFCVVIEENAPNILKEIAKQTGGLWFDNIKTEDEAKEAYRKIQMLALDGDACEIEWKSQVRCSQVVSVNISLKDNNLSQDLTFTTPNDRVAKLEIDPISLSLGEVVPGNSTEKTITVKSKNADFNVIDIQTSNPDFDINPKNFLLKSGESRDLKVTFSPSESAYFYSRFSIESVPCQSFFLYASGGFRNIAPKESTLKLTHPNGGEYFLVGSDTIIIWEGVLPEDTVSLEYSIDKGSNWNKISDSVSGLSYHWRNIPNPSSDECLVKVNKVKDQTSHMILYLLSRQGIVMMSGV